MRTMWMFAAFFKGQLLCLFCQTNNTVDSTLLGPEVVTAASGESVTISCQYRLKFRDNTKYWCKGPIYDLCEIVVKTPKNRPSNRSAITDDKEKGIITVTIHSLNKSDEGIYWCVIARTGRNIYTRVQLLISQIVPTLARPASSSLEKYELRWWEILRWILFIGMLFCLVSTHITVWRMKTAQQHQLRPKH